MKHLLGVRDGRGRRVFVFARQTTDQKPAGQFQTGGEKEVTITSQYRNYQKWFHDTGVSWSASLQTFRYVHAYHDPDNLYLIKDIRSAILVSEGDQSHNFIETTFQNAGLCVKIFTDESVAVKWLEESVNQ